jgi:hypothetical protein
MAAESSNVSPVVLGFSFLTVKYDISYTRLEMYLWE